MKPIMNEIQQQHIKIIMEHYGNNKNAQYIKSHHREEYKTLLELTSFLPKEAPTRQRIWHAEFNTWEIPKCNFCTNIASFYLKYKKYNDHCLDCYNKHRPDRVKAKKTFMENYGTYSPLKSPEIRQKIKDTCIKKYGVTNIFDSNIIKNKIKDTCILKYGVSSYVESDEAKQKQKDLYATVGEEYFNSIVEKRKASIKKQYGREHYSIVKYSDQTIDRINSKEWLTEMTINQKIPIYILCKQYLEDYDDSSLWIKLREFGIEPQRDYKQSFAEIKLTEFIASLVSIKSNDRVVIYPFELDIYVPDKKIAIEYCGLYWHSDAHKNNNYHKNKYDMCKEKGIRLIQIFEDEWLENENMIKSKLLYILHKSASSNLYARKTQIVEVSNIQKKVFFNMNHIQGDGPSSVQYGLVHEGVLVACIGFIKNQDGSFTLNRYATSTNVTGGFTKLLAHFEKKHNTPRIITFADLRWSEGNLYYNTGFIMDKKLKPDYYWTNAGVRYHKFNFRHSQMKKKLKKYDPSLSEYVNMKSNHYHRIFDAGKLRFIKN